MSAPPHKPAIALFIALPLWFAAVEFEGSDFVEWHEEPCHNNSGSTAHKIDEPKRIRISLRL
jgi:hypothetical protein